MNSEELLTELSQRGVILSAVDDKLRIDAPKGVLTSELRQALTEQKRALLVLLQSKPIAAAPAIQDTEAQEKELDEDIEPSEIQKIVVAPAIESYQSVWTLACCYLWLTSKNMNERKGVMFNTPRPFQELANKNFLSEVPQKAEWTTWNRLFGDALDNFLTSNESAAEEYTRNLKEVMCETPHWWREKYLATSELLTK